MRKILSLVVITFVACFFTISTSRAAGGKKGGDKPKRSPPESFLKLDTNGDGFLTKEEVVAGSQDKEEGEKRWSMLSKKDKDGDGKISLEEFGAGGEGGKQGKHGKKK